MSTSQTSPPRVAVVTGGSRGIGRAVSARLARDGQAVGIVYSADTDAAEKAVAQIADEGGRAVAVRADVADEHQTEAAFDQLGDEFGGIDVVVHAAGTLGIAPLVDLDLDALDDLHRLNIRGTFVVDQLAARRVRAGGAIVNVSTSVTRLSPPGYTAYAASKAAVEAMTLVLAREMRGRDVTVNAVAPGPTATTLFLDGRSDEVIDQAAHLSPFDRLGEPEDIAEVVSLLAGAGRWINGQVVFVNGGVA